MCYVCALCRLSGLVSLVSDGLHYEFATEAERVNYGNRLKAAIANFTVDFIPHMNEEEEVNVKMYRVCTWSARI